MKSLAGGRFMDDAHDSHTVLHASDDDGPGGDAAQEVGSAVDRIYHPCVTRSARKGSVFLSDGAVLGIFRRKLLADECLDIPVGLGDQVLMTLARL
jgi:hypothetical protein